MPTTTIQGHHVAFLTNCNIVLWKCDAAATVEFGDQQVRLSRNFFSHHANAMEYDKPQFEWQQHTQIFGGLGSVNDRADRWITCVEVKIWWKYGRLANQRENGKVCKNPWSRSLDSQDNPEAQVSTIVLLFASVVLSCCWLQMVGMEGIWPRQMNEQFVTTDSLLAVVHGESHLI